jgi:hypothetical protein
MADPPKRPRRIPKVGLAAIPNRTLSTEDELRKLFTDANILQRETQGELIRRILKTGEFNVKLDNETDYVRTVIYGFFTKAGNKEVARTHCYQRRNGTLAASGLLDPKRVFHNGTLYYIEK